MGGIMLFLGNTSREDVVKNPAEVWQCLEAEVISYKERVVSSGSKNRTEGTLRVSYMWDGARRSKQIFHSGSAKSDLLPPLTAGEQRRLCLYINKQNPNDLRFSTP